VIFYAAEVKKSEGSTRSSKPFEVERHQQSRASGNFHNNGIYVGFPSQFWRREIRDGSCLGKLLTQIHLRGKARRDFIRVEPERKRKTYGGSNATDVTGHGQESQQQESSKRKWTILFNPR
jgi:hypothetical protein